MKRASILLIALAAFACKKNITPQPAGTSPTNRTIVTSTTGIGGFPITSVNDRAIAFDYDHSGKQDHILVYQPGANTAQIFKNTGTVGSPVYTSIWSSTTGIGGYQLTQACPAQNDIPLDLGSDKIIAYDYDHSGLMDHLLCYRPGAGLCTILANNNGSFTPVFTSTTGIGGYDLKGVSDKICAMYYGETGLNTDLVCYRPGYGFFWLLSHGTGTTFTPVSKGNSGVGGYNLADPDDQITPVPFETAQFDAMAMYRPGTGIFWIVYWNSVQGQWTQALKITSGGLADFDLSQPQDRLFAYDYYGTGVQNEIFCFRPGGGKWAVEQGVQHGLTMTFSPVIYGLSGGLGTCAFGYTPTSSDGWVCDRGFAFDYQSNGQQSGLAFFDGGNNVFDVFKTSAGTIFQVY